MTTQNSTHNSALMALSPLDGRYAKKADGLRWHFSEAGFMRARVRVELTWLEALSRLAGAQAAVRCLARAAGKHREKLF
jgi:adenylosuccinate lyase